MNIDKHFEFLEKSYGFIKIPEYGYSRELHSDYVKDGLIIKIVYDGGYWVDILKPKIEISDILKGVKHTSDYEFSNFNWYKLSNLDLDKTIWNSVSSDNFPDKSLWYFAKLLRENNEILNGNLKKLHWTYLILRKLGLKKN
jgi:hypothetical protein